MTTSSSPTSSRTWRERHGVEERPCVELLLGGGAVALRRAGSRSPAATPSSNCALRVGVGGERGVDAAVDLLVHARHAEDDLRVHLLQVRRELTGVGAAVHGEPEDQRLVVARHPLGDVRHRQVRHDPHARIVVELEALAELLDGVHDVVLADHHALRRTRRAARVDQRREVVRVGRRGKGREVGAAVGHRARSPAQPRRGDPSPGASIT